MVTVSLCMIVRDEEEVLGRCLESARGIYDELIIVDTGSVDRTKEIALEFGAKVYDFPWIDDFAAARNASFEKATMEYILWLDADDVIDEENRQGFLTLKESLADIQEPVIDTVMMLYHVAFDIKGRPTYTFYRERLVRRAAGYRWYGRVHEVIIATGPSIQCEIAIRHEKLRKGDPERNLRIYQRMIEKGEPMPPRHRYYYARELFANGCDERARALLEQTIGDADAFLENRIGACRDLAGCCLRSGDTDGAMRALCRSFMLGEPRAEICCDIGHILVGLSDYRAAIFWYKAAPKCTPSEQGGGFAMPECRGYIPYMQLCLCHDTLGEYELAEAYNEKALEQKPGDESAEANRLYFLKRREG